jgi:ATP-binding cassette subfamily B protein
VAVPWLFKWFFDTLTTQNRPQEEISSTLFSILVIVSFVVGARWVLHRISGITNVFLQARVMSDMLTASFENLLGHSYRFYSNVFTGSLVRKVSRLSRAYEDFTDQITGSLIPTIVISAGVLSILFSRNTVLGSLLLGWMAIFLGIHVSIALWKMKYDRLRSEKDSESTGVLADALTNIIPIKLFSNYEYEKARYQKVTGELRHLRILGWGIGEAVDALQGALMIAIELALYFLWLRYWEGGTGLVTTGDFVLIQGFIAVLFTKIWEFGRVVRRLHESVADAAEMVEIIDTPYDIQDRRNAKELRVRAGKIEVKDVTFGFHGTRNVLKNFTLTIKPGEKVALVGSSGAGKTTITALLLRFHDVDGGEIIVDGQNIAHVTQTSLRQEIALVPQDTILFHRTLMENIRYGKLNATDKEVIEAAKKAHCHEFISQLPYGYETFVGERGVKLSGGERQRVAIARAILKNAQILILDEATSSLDSEVERLIQDALETLMKKKTAIVVAHRLSTIRKMDRIIVIRDGAIISEGTHDLLLEKDGIYKKLWQIQAGGFVKK